MTYTQLQFNLMKGEPAFFDMDHEGSRIQAQVIAAIGYERGADDVSRATVIWVHKEWPENQVDTIEMDRLYVEPEEEGEQE